MLLDSVRNMLRWHSPHAVSHPAGEPVQSLAEDAALAEDDDPVWPAARVSVVEALWGAGFVVPGGDAEVLRLTAPLGLSDASSLLLVGAGSGGPARRIAEEFGVWVTGYEENPHLAEIANDRNRRAGLGRRARVECWDPGSPRFPRRYFHHAMAMEALRGARPELLVTALSRALKPGGQLVLIELVSDRSLDPADPIVATWARLDHRPAVLPNELMITALLRCLGFDVRIVEDVSRRNMRNAIAGWRAAVQSMSRTPLSPRRLAMVVREAELWLARFRLMRRGTLRLVRWHAIATGAPSG